MLLTIGDFKNRVRSEMTALVTELQELTGRSTPEEEKAWRSSLPKIAAAFSNSSFNPLHLYFQGKGSLSLEYQLPASSSWCDMVLLGRHQGKSAAVIVELKDWTTHADKPGSVEGLIERFGEPVLHPSDQVRGYTEYCRRFHSAVHAYGANVSGCVVFTHDFFVSSYEKPPNNALVAAYPCFTLAPQDVEASLPAYFAERLSEPDEGFAQEFEAGTYKQDRGFIRQIGQQILNPKNSEFELLDSQRRALSVTKDLIHKALFSGESELQKQVIIIDGPPGSGKSILAAKIWADLVTDERLPDGSAVFATTSASQNSNWAYLFRQAAHDAAGSGVVKRTASYTPITTQRLGALRRKHGEQFLGDPLSWREHIRTLRALGEKFQDGGQDEQYLISIVDEAHALINPEEPEGRGQYGFVTSLGPQAYHVIRSSTVSIFLLDGKQSFRDRENTSPEQIRTWAKELGARVATDISLADTQFRCAGSKEYVEWVEAVLRGETPAVCRELAQGWLGVLDLRIFESPEEMEACLRERIAENKTARLLASYARKWKTKGAAAPHDLPDDLKDFHEPYTKGGQMRYWSRVWNYVAGNGSDYTHFIQARPGSRMHEDQLSEVGCPYAVRGFDFDYVGLLWLGDLQRRDSKWRADAAQVFETGLDRTLAAVRHERDMSGSAHVALYNALAQGYRILMTRPMQGIYLWFEDVETREYVEACIASAEVTRKPGGR